ncbi:FAD-binding oxidoreductase [Marinovum sp. 2_MG-2023]|uniref:NAD(P)/FAD-dependent oxidoreductase n=1 Tax=unclassified Marinovum TaxID=2647166 RepID=UPI0026E3A25A|nr:MULTISPECIES: FAD-binding oxidoreductase [unclassified Marinovum]MDO6729213.1 FAD-binding oxidoreductase [Marinovum sp. 2_MG-2023]MDO6779160.1 FAD-binding oxidoreductase [Marinovum sp. 1_MG-2023]
MSTAKTTSTIVVGAGVIGAAIAHDLQKRGRNVTLVDRNAPGSGASYGNMASIAVSEFMPVARPSTWRQIPGWMIDPEGPIRVSPRYMPRLIPWFIRFLAASRPSAVRRLETAGAALCQRALVDTQTLMADLGIADQLSQTGCLSLYANEAEFQADRERIDMLDRFDFDYDVLDAPALRRLEPEITDQITKAVLLPDNRTVADPGRLVKRLVTRFETMGGILRRARVTGFDRSTRITGVRLGAEVLRADEVILCAGAFTARLSRMLGEPMPLETERGYHTQIMAPGIEMAHSIIWPARAFMVSPTAGGIRVGGTVEMAGLDAAPDYRRSRITVRRACEALPNLKVQDFTEWMGHRPAVPDTIPVMSASARTPGVFYATGHGHLGLTQAATSALLMGDLITGTRPAIDMSPYRIDRF